MAATLSKDFAGKVNYRHPTLIGILASGLLTALVIIGSRNLEHFDPALFGYTVASIVAFGAIVFRYALWLQRPATRAYFMRGLKLFFQKKKFLRNTADASATVATNLVEQRFIFKRGIQRWMMHFLIMWGCIISALITFPLVWGWIHFKLEGARATTAPMCSGFRYRRWMRAACSRGSHFTRSI